ncbi:hypothetical protein GBF38_009654 [Nibea albiflora]|uniref:Uncharacterized protein n=1 Tax=Nibea albiflora TaxID=240163 RepID=A0ACB7F949_NIBAL|nr:hypothetical protein GBF38_009654 [Nibea albiflora]
MTLLLVFASVAGTCPFHSWLLRLLVDVNMDMINGAIPKAAEDTSFCTIFYLSTGNFNGLA